MLEIYEWSKLNDKQKSDVLRRPDAGGEQNAFDVAQKIINDVRSDGDEAVRRYTEKFDGCRLEEFKVSRNDIDAAVAEIPAEDKEAIDFAYRNIRLYHQKQGFQPFSVSPVDGVECSRRVVPVERVGLYVPGGRAPLISTTLMNGVPAQIAGCPTRILCTPCNKDGQINPYIPYAANLCGIDTIYKIGGAQAVAAMAFGTQSIPSVDKIFGPGNAYVTAAKQLVAMAPGGAALDTVAGPSEVLIVADGEGEPSLLAADLLAQAEHDPLAHVVLVTVSRDMAEAVKADVIKQMKDLPRLEIINEALQNSVILIAPDLGEAMHISNLYAPEHLIVPEACVDAVTNAGSVFTYNWATVAFGDYCSGPTHVLPTNGNARSLSGLSVEAFQKIIPVQHISREGAAALSGPSQTLARLEGLEAHARAAQKRAGA
jgi:histidinol dehydrogenase